MNDLLLQALRCENTSRPPVWLMRQAGRYMPEYRALREKHSLINMFHSPELIAEVTKLPMELVGVDAAILFSDILLVVEALGKNLHFEEGRGPVISEPVSTPFDVEDLPEPDPVRGFYGVAEGIKILKEDLEVPLIGFAGAPFTVASYLVEGGSSKDFKKTRTWMWHDPEVFHQLLQKTTAAIISSLQMQIEAGVQAIQLFDSWAHVLNYTDFHQVCVPYYEQIMAELDPEIPVILFCRGSSVFYREMAALQPAAIGLDWNCDISLIRHIIPENVALQGNLDPFLLYAPEKLLRERVNQILDAMEGEPGFIFNLGHGISPDVPVSAVRAVVETIKERE